MIARAARRVRAGSEDGVTIVEVMVGAMIAVTIIGASAVLFSRSSDSSLASQRQSELIAVADQQIENIRQQVKTSANGFSALAMSSAPAAGSNSKLSFSATTDTDPNDFVVSGGGCGTSNEGYLIENNYDDTSEGVVSAVAPWSGCTTGAEPLVVQSGGLITPKQTNVQVGSDTATVYTYVTDVYVGCSSSLGSCTSTTGDARRVVVAVLMNSGSRADIGQTSPVYVSTVFTNPVPSNQINNSIGLTLGVNIG
jgi:Tfp pilus assembly protein PilW